MAYVVTRNRHGLAGIRPEQQTGAPRPRPPRHPFGERPIVRPGRGRPQAPAGLGDVICLEGDCKAGTLLVQEMQATFKSLSGVGKDELDDSDVEFLRLFGQPVTQTVEAFQRENSKLSRQIPFSLVCCTIKELGRKAQDLTRQMRDFRKTAQTTETPVTPPFTGPGADIGKGLGTLFLIVGAALAAVIVLPSLTGGARRR